MLKVEIKTSYSNETFMIPDWKPDIHTNFYGHKFYSLEDFADFYLCGELCFCDAFDITKISEATEQDIEAYAVLMEQDYEELTTKKSWPEWKL